MSDPSLELFTALRAAAKADAGVLASMGGKAKIYDIPPTGAAKPYVVFDPPSVIPDLADCMDASEAEVTAHVWSLTNPPGHAEAMTIAAALQAVMLVSPMLASFTVGDPILIRTEHFTDPDGKTAHSIVTVSYDCDAVA